MTEIQHLPNGWDLVTHGTWQISVGPDAFIMLPRHLAPEEVPDFVTAVNAAAEVATTKRGNALAAAASDDRSLPPRVHVTEAGAIPPGAVRMPVATGPNAPASQAAIGRPRRLPGPPQPRTTIPTPPKAR